MQQTDGLHSSHDRDGQEAVSGGGIGCLAERLLRVSGSAVPAETRSAFKGCTFQHEVASAQQRSAFQEESVTMRQLRLRGTREGENRRQKGPPRL